MADKDLFPEDSGSKYSQTFDLGDDQSHIAPLDTGESTSSLRLLQGWGLGCSLSLIIFISAALVFLISASAAIGTVWLVVENVAGGPDADAPGYWEAVGAGLILGAALWTVVAVWRGARQGVDGALSVLTRPPIFIFIGALIAMLGVVSLLFGESQDLPLFFSGAVFGFSLTILVVAVPWTIRLTRKAWQLSYNWAAREPYRAGVITGVIFLVTTLFCLSMLDVLLDAIDEINTEDAGISAEKPPEEARFMGIMSGNGWTEDDELIARRRDDCFETLGDTSSEIFEQGHWKAYRRLRTEDRAEDAVFLAILKTCEAHGDEAKDNVESFFHRVLTNHLNDLDDRRVREASLCRIDLEDTVGIQPPSQSERAQQRQYLAAVQRAFCDLSPDQKKALQASSLGHSHREIATELNTSIPNARQLVSRGRRNVRANLHN